MVTAGRGGDRAGLVTLGETLAVFAGDQPGPLRVGSALRFTVAGAESTVAIGVARLGHPAMWVGRVGDDDHGRIIQAQFRAEGLDPSGVHVDPGAPTALLIRQARTADQTRVSYRRSGSAGSRLSPADLPEASIAAAGILHVTGITPALSASAAAAVDQAVAVARRAGVTVSFDVNYRSALWDPGTAGPVLRKLAGQADVVFAGPDELALISAAGPGELLAHGVSEVVVKDGPHGCSATTADGTSQCPARRVTVVDPVGAGDAFAAGYLSARLDGLPLAGRLERATILGAVCVATLGDWEGLPRRDELDSLARSADVVR
jgi:2-dehydro-3-deoxygluconokinase